MVSSQDAKKFQIQEVVCNGDTRVRKLDINAYTTADTNIQSTIFSLSNCRPMSRLIALFLALLHTPIVCGISHLCLRYDGRFS